MMSADAVSHAGLPPRIATRAATVPAPVLSPTACAVHLIDRRTGQSHRINGRPLVLFTRTPDVAVAELLDGRDATIWEARVEPIGAADSIAFGRA
jgi:hypothetical protein